MDHTGCHQLSRVLTHNNNASEKCQPYAVVRGAQRAEYTVFGDAINLSARLMCKAKGGMGMVLTDEPTQQSAKRAALFRKLTLLPVKVGGCTRVNAVVKAPGFQPFNLKCDILVSQFTFKWVNLRRYVKGKAELVEVFAVKPHPSAGGGAGGIGGGAKVGGGTAVDSP
jgi:class 3 adenylate cyclase